MSEFLGSVDAMTPLGDVLDQMGSQPGQFVARMDDDNNTYVANPNDDSADRVLLKGGDDTSIGGNGDDTFIFETGEQSLTITDIGQQ